MKLIIVILMAGLVVLAGARLFSRKMLYFPVNLEPGRQARLEGFSPGVAPVSFEVEQGIVLKGWFVQKENLPVVFYFGGNAEEVSLNIEDFLAKVPASLVLVNYRGYGESQGRPTEAALKSDCLKVFDAMAERLGLDPLTCLAWGRSLGSSMAAYLAKERGLGGLILTCPFDSIAAVAASYYPSWLVNFALTDPHRTLDFSSAIRSRTLVLAAEADEIIPFERTAALYQGLTCQKEMTIISGAGHNTISEGKGYWEAIQIFLESLRKK